MQPQLVSQASGEPTAARRARLCALLFVAGTSTANHCAAACMRPQEAPRCGPSARVRAWRASSAYTVTAARLAFRTAGRPFPPERTRPAALTVTVDANADSAALESKGDSEGEPPEVEDAGKDVLAAALQSQLLTLQ